MRRIRLTKILAIFLALGRWEEFCMSFFLKGPFFINLSTNTVVGGRVKFWEFIEIFQHALVWIGHDTKFSHCRSRLRQFSQHAYDRNNTYLVKRKKVFAFTWKYNPTNKLFIPLKHKKISLQLADNFEFFVFLVILESFSIFIKFSLPTHIAEKHAYNSEMVWCLFLTVKACDREHAIKLKQWVSPKQMSVVLNQWYSEWSCVWRWKDSFLPQLSHL